MEITYFYFSTQIKYLRYLSKLSLMNHLHAECLLS